MCGIAGHFKGGSLSHHDLELFREMLDSLKHRGPNNTDMWRSEDNKLLLGHTRLSILDLSDAGNQPMKSRTNRFVISFNGEIYNHLELRNHFTNEWLSTSDTETLLRCIESWGLIKTLESIEGMFAFAVYDTFADKLYLCRDRFGEKPLYFGSLSKHKNEFIFSSEIQSISKRLDFDSDLDMLSISRVLKNNNTGASQTIFSNISKLPPSSILEYDLKTCSYKIYTYWSAFDFAINSRNQSYSLDYGEAVLQVEDLLKNTVRKQMLSDVPVGCFLSGGIDSTTIAALMQSESVNPIDTFSIGAEGSEIDEAISAKKIAKYLGTSHHELYLNEDQIIDVIPEALSLYGEPFADSSQIPTLLVSKLAKKHVSVALTGDAGDEIFGGYNRYLYADRYWPKVRMIPLFLRKLASESSILNTTFSKLFLSFPNLRNKYEDMNLKLQKISSSLYSKDIIELYENFVTSNGYEKCILPEYRVTDSFNIETQLFAGFELMMQLDIISYLPNDILTKVDRASMRCSLETRTPYLNHHLYELVCGLPKEFKINNGTTKHILRSINKKLIPIDLIDQPKTGFGIPIGKWMKGSLSEFAHSMIFNDDLSDLNLVDNKQLKIIWKDHQSGKFDYSSLLWSFVSLGAWFEGQKT